VTDRRQQIITISQIRENREEFYNLVVRYHEDKPGNSKIYGKSTDSSGQEKRFVRMQKIFDKLKIDRGQKKPSTASRRCCDC